MSIEGNAAWQMPQNEPVQEPQEKPQETREERLRELRKKQLNFGPGEEFTKEERKEFLQLQETESGAMTNFEKDRYRQLTIKRDNEGLSETERQEFVVLQRKVDEGGLRN